MTDILTDIIIRKREAEKALASAAFLRPDIALTECGWLSPGDITDERVRKFWTVLLESKDQTVAALAVGTDYLGELAAGAGSEGIFYGSGVNQHADNVAKEAWFYAVASRLGSLAKALSAGEMERAQAIIGDIDSEAPKAATQIPNSADVGIDFLAGISESNQTIMTGTKLDQSAGGLWRSTLSILCARPSIGKTALGFQIARNIAASGNKVIFASMEMGRRALWARAACGVARIAYRDILAKRVSDAKLAHLTRCNTELIDKYGDNLLIDDKPQSTSDLWRKVASANPDVVVVDHIRLFLDHGDNETRRLGEITWNMKQIAKEFNIHVMGLAQLNRQLESRQDKRPTLSDLRDSGQIEENADFVMGLHRERTFVEKPTEKSPAELVILKFRDGPADILLRLTFDGLGQWFEDRVPEKVMV